jgi:phosphoenolpyruvate carboxykinase (ATP)
MRYAALLGERIERHAPSVWLVNTGWAGGPYGVGERMPIRLTRAVVAAVLDGSLDESSSDVDPVFGFAVPRTVPGVPEDMLRPRDAWPDGDAYDAAANRLARDLVENFAHFAGTVPAAVLAAGPDVA